MGNVAWADLPALALGAIVALGVVQLSLQVLALVTVFRTPEERLVTGRRWVWVAVVALGQLVGAIVFLAAARKPTPAPDPVSTAPDAERDGARRAADLLYGDRSPEERRRKER
ncbi:MAG: hypothetical protein Kow0097_06560 [Candidatus Bipolaricaulota bacterium]